MPCHVRVEEVRQLPADLGHVAAEPLALKRVAEVGHDVPLGRVEQAWLETVAREHVQPVTLDLRVEAVEVDVPHLEILLLIIRTRMRAGTRTRRRMDEDRER